MKPKKPDYVEVVRGIIMGYLYKIGEKNPSDDYLSTAMKLGTDDELLLENINVLLPMFEKAKKELEEKLK